jgi:hypothetical protein
LFITKELFRNIVSSPFNSLEHKIIDEKNLFKYGGLKFELFDELNIFCRILNKQKTAIECLDLIETTCGSFPNLSIALRILLTIPITTVSAERSFSKLKLIKNYLRTSMVQNRLSDLALISIERALCENLNYNDIIEKFSELKSRKINFV